MSFFERFKLEKYLTIVFLMVGLCFILVYTYFTFIHNSKDYKTDDMYIGSLMYSIKINGEPTFSVNVPSGKTEYTIEITSLNNIDSFYKLIYRGDNDISISYRKGSDVSSGKISNSKTIVVQITNNSQKDVLVDFDVASGYIMNDIEEVIIPEGFSEIYNSYISNNINKVAIYVDGKEVSSLDSSKNYTLSSYECNNGESLTWSNSDKGIYIYPITKTTGCSVYLEESKILHEIILADYNGGESDANIDFNTISSLTNGNGLYYTSDTSLTEDYDGDGTGDRVYYYRGAVENNYLYFADKCWRMVRIVEDGSVRLKYGGTGTIGDDGNITCPQTGTNVTTTSSQYWNSTYNQNRYVGYMFGSSCTSYATCHTNSSNSTIKTALTNWYNTNINSTQSEATLALIKDSIYCNDRTLYSGNGYSTNKTYYGAWGRLFEATKKAPTYKCSRADDKFTVSTTNGNGKSTRPVGLLTADEVAFAGGVSGVENKSYFMYINHDFYTMSPAHFYGSFSQISQVFNIRENGAILSDTSSGIAYGLLPVISIDKYAEINSGSGIYNDPYVIDPDL